MPEASPRWLLGLGTWPTWCGSPASYPSGDEELDAALAAVRSLQDGRPRGRRGRMGCGRRPVSGGVLSLAAGICAFRVEVRTAGGGSGARWGSPDRGPSRGPCRCGIRSTAWRQNAHLKIFYERLAERAGDAPETYEMDIYGAPSEGVLKSMQQVPGAQVQVHPVHLGGFLRPQRCD
jgi:hypothetical protein